MAVRMLKLVSAVDYLDIANKPITNTQSNSNVFFYRKSFQKSLTTLKSYNIIVASIYRNKHSMMNMTATRNILTDKLRFLTII